MGLFSDIHDPLVRSLVNTAEGRHMALLAEPVRVSEPTGTLHGEHCYAEVETVEWTHRHGRQVTGTTFVLVCGWPDEHK